METSEFCDTLVKTGYYLETIEMLSKRVLLSNKHGLHTRAAAKLVDTASLYACDIELHAKSKNCNAKSIMGVITLGAGEGTMLEIRAEGRDSRKAITALTELIQNRFYEVEEGR